MIASKILRVIYAILTTSGHIRNSEPCWVPESSETGQGSGLEIANPDVKYTASKQDQQMK